MRNSRSCAVASWRGTVTTMTCPQRQRRRVLNGRTTTTVSLPQPPIVSLQRPLRHGCGREFHHSSRRWASTTTTAGIRNPLFDDESPLASPPPVPTSASPNSTAASTTATTTLALLRTARLYLDDSLFPRGSFPPSVMATYDACKKQPLHLTIAASGSGNICGHERSPKTATATDGSTSTLSSFVPTETAPPNTAIVAHRPPHLRSNWSMSRWRSWNGWCTSWSGTCHPP
jgi:hypothetical protein